MHFHFILKFSLIVIISTAFQFNAFAEELTPAGRLRKLSLQIKGVLPAQKEYEELKTIQPSNYEEFFKGKAIGYLESDWAVSKLRERILEDLRLDVPASVNNYLVQTLNSNQSQDRELLPAVMDPNQTQFMRNLKQLIERGNFDDIYLSDFFIKLAAANIVRNDLSYIITNEATGRGGVTRFVSRAKELGYSFDNLDNTKKAVDDFNAKPDLFIPDVLKNQNQTEIELLQNIQSYLHKFLKTAEQAYTDFPNTNTAQIQQEIQNRKEGLIQTKIDEPIKSLVQLLEKEKSTSMPEENLKAKIRTELGEFKATLSTNYFYYSNNAIRMTFYSQVPGSRYRTTYTMVQNSDDFNIYTCLMSQLHNLHYKRINMSRDEYTYRCTLPSTNISGFDTVESELKHKIIQQIANFENKDAVNKFASEIINDHLYQNKYPSLAQKMNEAYRSNFGNRSGNIESFFKESNFTDRYSKTKFSKSAAFFRIYFCDEMRPVAIVDQSTKSQQALKELFITKLGNNQNVQLSQMNTTNDIEENHVKGDCVGCHRKLDPIQKQIGLNQKIDDPTKRFELVYDDENGKEHRAPVANSKELLKVVGQQEQYLKCQTRKFWNWIIGEDIPLRSDIHQKLITQFNSVKRNHKDFTLYLTTLPEFYNDDILTRPPTFISVQNTLNKCNSCHNKVESSIIPSFSKIPIGNGIYGDKKENLLKEHQEYIGAIVKQTDLANGGKSAVMPPSHAGWKLSEIERTKIGRWIYHRGLDENEQPTLSQDFADSQFQNASDEFKTAVTKKQIISPTYRNTWKRYLENSDLIKVLLQKLPAERATCTINIMYGNQTELGFKDKLTGLPAAEHANLAFREMYTKCLKEILTIVRNDSLMNTSTGTANQRRLIPMLGLATLSNLPTVNWSAMFEMLNSKWSDLPESDKSSIIKNISNYFLGDNTYSDVKLKGFNVATQSAITKYLQTRPQASVRDISLILVYLTLNDDKFLSY